MRRIGILFALVPALFVGVSASAADNDKRSEEPGPGPWWNDNNFGWDQQALDQWMQRMMRSEPWHGPIFPAEMMERRPFSPRVELKESKDAFTVTADVPGIDEKDLDVTLSGSRLSIRGKRMAEKSEQSDHYFERERAYGSFERSLTLPDSADGDHMEAKLDKGVLTLHIPKKAGQQEKRITIKGAVDKVRSWFGKSS